eukprot:3151917-Pyramimonas_sp.AAC.1
MGVILRPRLRATERGRPGRERRAIKSGRRLAGRSPDGARLELAAAAVARQLRGPLAVNGLLALVPRGVVILQDAEGAAPLPATAKRGSEDARVEIAGCVGAPQGGQVVPDADLVVHDGCGHVNLGAW